MHLMFSTLQEQMSSGCCCFCSCCCCCCCCCCCYCCWKSYFVSIDYSSELTPKDTFEIIKPDVSQEIAVIKCNEEERGSQRGCSTLIPVILIGIFKSNEAWRPLQDSKHISEFNNCLLLQKND